MKFDRREMARDLMGLGSIPFLILVVVRVAMVGNFLELFHIVFAVAVFGLAGTWIRGLHYHTGRIVIMAIFTSVFYDDLYFAVFALVVAGAGVLSFDRILGVDRVYTSLGIGLLCCLVSYLVSIPLPISNW